MDRTNTPDLKAIAVRRQSARRHAQARYWRFYRGRADWSFVQNFARAPIRWDREHGVLLALIAVVGFLSFVVVPGWASVSRDDRAPAASAILSVPVSLPPPPIAPAAADDHGTGDDWSVVTVERGQTVGALFAQQGLSASLLHRFIDETRFSKALARVLPGQQFGFLRRPDGELAALRMDADQTKRVVLHVDGSTIREEVIERPIERRVRVAQGRIENSLFAAGDTAGLSDALIMQLANVFAYDIDFAQDIRRGDEFAVIFEEFYQEGERVRGGAILGATFTNRNRRHVAVRYEYERGRFDFYDADGRSLRKAFLRTPVEFSRISSRFTSGRMHPVLGRMRAHRGVDYAAPTGTPIRAAGDGKVQFRGWRAGYGNAVIVEHGGRYTTLYGHMSRFASGIRQGQRVQQGQLIGHVGMTGLATGPHLHYEFRVGGVHRDPLTVDLPKAEPLASAQLPAFRRSSAPLLAQLEQLEQRSGTLASR